MATPSNAAFSEIKAELGDLLINFNGATMHLNNIIVGLVGAKQPVEFLMHHMNEGTLSQVMNALAKHRPENSDDERQIKDRLLHGQIYFERVRLWRNHYAHHIVPSGAGLHEETNTAYMLTYSLKAKDKVILRLGAVTADEIRAVNQHCRTLKLYLLHLRRFLDQVAGTPDPVLDGKQVSLPDKPPLIDTYESTLQ